MLSVLVVVRCQRNREQRIVKVLITIISISVYSSSVERKHAIIYSGAATRKRNTKDNKHKNKIGCTLK